MNDIKDVAMSAPSRADLIQYLFQTNDLLAQENAWLKGALRSVITATSAYLPPDGTSAKDCISAILAAMDNPEIVALFMRGRPL